MPPLPTNKEQAELERLAASAELDKSLARLGNAIADRTQQDEASGKGKVVQFPLAFPPDKPPVSNPLARSSLFAAIQGKDRRMMQKETVAAQDGFTIKFSGQQWNQSDHDLFMQLVQLASHRGDLAKLMSVPANAILRALGRGTGKSQHEQLKADMHRLSFGTLSIDAKGIHYIGHLVEKAVQDERLPTHKRHWAFQLNPDLVPMFARTLYTLNDWEKRLALGQKDLAKWLQLVIESHAQHFPTSVEWYRERSGSTNTPHSHAFAAASKKHSPTFRTLASSTLGRLTTTTLCIFRATQATVRRSTSARRRKKSGHGKPTATRPTHAAHRHGRQRNAAPRTSPKSSPSVTASEPRGHGIRRTPAPFFEVRHPVNASTASGEHCTASDERFHGM